MPTLTTGQGWGGGKWGTMVSEKLHLWRVGCAFHSLNPNMNIFLMWSLKNF